MDARPDADAELLERLSQRDVRGAATILVRTYGDEVYGLCRAMVRDATTAEDLTQDVFARAFSGLASFRGDASVRTWILRIARNRCIDHLRAKGRQPWDPQDEVSPDEQPTDVVAIDELLIQHGQIHVALEALGENERALVVLRYGHGLGYAELAQAFGVGEGAARMRVSRALGRMRDAILEAAQGPPAPESPPSAPRRRAAPMGGSAGAPPVPRGAPLPAPPAAPAPAAPPPRSAPLPVPSAPPPQGAPAPSPGAPPRPGAPPPVPVGSPPPGPPSVLPVFLRETLPEGLHDRLQALVDQL